MDIWDLIFKNIITLVLLKLRKSKIKNKSTIYFDNKSTIYFDSYISIQFIYYITKLI